MKLFKSNRFDVIKISNYLLTFFISSSILGSNSFIVYEQKFMNSDWQFIPDLPQAFNSSESKLSEVSLYFKGMQIEGLLASTDLSLTRLTEPKDVSLLANKKSYKAGYYSRNNYLYLISSYQKADQQSFECYTFNTITIGSCKDSDLQISSDNPLYSSLGNKIIQISGQSKTNGVGIQRYINDFWINSFSIEALSTDYNYTWLSSLEDITSPFLLNLTISGTRLGDALDSGFRRLPQRTEWSSHQLNIGINQKFYSIYNFNLIAEYDLVFIEFPDYQQYKDTPKINLKFRAGIEFITADLSMLFYGDAYVNNLIGFEPITFNQRTEHYFDQPYGELGIRLQYTF